MNRQSTVVTRATLADYETSFVPGTTRLPGQDGPPRHGGLLEILRRRRLLIAWVAICGTVAVAALAWLLPPRYTAKAQLVVQGARSPHGDDPASSRETAPDQATIQTQVTALSSHDLLASVITRLSNDPQFRAIELRGSGSLPHLADPGARTAVIEELERHLNVFQEAGSHVVSVAYTSKNPAEAAAIANEIADYYLAAGEDRSRAAPDQAVTALNQKIADLRAESESLAAALAAYQAAHGVNDGSKTGLIDQKLGDLNHQLSATQAELAARRTRYAELLASRGPKGNWEPLLAGLDAQGLVDLHGQVLAVLAGRQDSIVAMSQAGAAGLSGPAAPQPLYEKVRKELDQALLKLSYEKNVASAQAGAIEQRLNSVQRASDDVRLHDLVAAATAARQRYGHLVQRRDELLEQGDDVTAPARLLSHAAVPHRPSSLSPLLFLAPGFVVFLMIGGVVALLRDRLDQGIYTVNDVESMLGPRCAGFLPLSDGVIPAEATAMGTGAVAESFTEALRGILVSLQLVAPHRRKPQVILVTSSVAGEGKTTLAMGLAAYAVRMGAKVLLLDMDAHALTDRSAPSNLVPREQSNVPAVDLFALDPGRIVEIPTGAATRLDYLPVRRGPEAELPPLFSGDQMSKLLRRQWSGYDLIFIDSAPVLAKAEVRLLAAIADQVLFAVRWRKTRRDDARAALSLFRGCGPNGANIAATVSVAITQVDLAAYAPGSLNRALGKVRQLFDRRAAQVS
jgi:uncharacterized protein involved in exopolysaccharide biosynthesis/Mrp family chromosome partitioning ATPase